MNRPLTLSVAALIAGVGVSGVAFTAAAQAQSFDHDDVISALDSNQTATDALPASLVLDDIGLGGIDPGSPRLIGSDGAHRFWVALDAAGDLCLIAEAGDRQRTIAAACNRVDRVARGGLLLGFQGEGPETVAYLLPDGTDLDGVGDAWHVVSENVVTARPDRVTSIVRLALPNGGTIPLVP